MRRQQSTIRVSKSVGIILFSLVMTSARVQTLAESHNMNPQETIESFYNEWTSLDQNFHFVDEREAKKLQMVSQFFYLARLGAQILQKRWEKLSPREQASFLDALARAIKNKLERDIAPFSTLNNAKIELKKTEIKKDFATVYHSAANNELSFYMLRKEDGSWKIINVKFGKNSLLRHYYSFCKKLLDKYSMAYLIAELGEYGSVVLEDFEANEVNQLPMGWSWKDKDDKKNKPYRVREEHGNRYLEARDHGESVILGKDIKWNLKEYPYVSFRWRVHKIPEGADERYNKSVDSAAGIYFVYRKKMGLIPESVKYVWSSTLPVGSAMKRNGVGRPWMVVAESGKERLGEWRTYVFNAYEAYKATFGGNPPNRPIGVGVLSDANSMRRVNPDAVAYADYDDIRALKHADANSGVKKILKAE